MSVAAPPPPKSSPPCPILPYSATRALLRVLEEKGHIKHEPDGPRYVFSPIIPRARARRSALKHLLQTFFDDSAGDAVAALLDVKKLEAKELDRIEAMIDKARKETK
jgi:BlaI family penicillinase repressor